MGRELPTPQQSCTSFSKGRLSSHWAFHSYAHIPLQKCATKPLTVLALLLLRAAALLGAWAEPFSSCFPSLFFSFMDLRGVERIPLSAGQTQGLIAHKKMVQHLVQLANAGRDPPALLSSLDAPIFPGKWLYRQLSTPRILWPLPRMYSGLFRKVHLGSSLNVPSLTFQILPLLGGQPAALYWGALLHLSTWGFWGLWQHLAGKGPSACPAWSRYPGGLHKDQKEAVISACCHRWWFFCSFFSPHAQLKTTRAHWCYKLFAAR